MMPAPPPAASGFRIEDLYKLLHQAYHGPGHAIPTAEAAAMSLRREWATLAAMAPEVAARGSAAPGVAAPEVAAPEVPAPEVAAPEEEAREVAVSGPGSEELPPAFPLEPLIEIPTPDALFVRVHLRPYRNRGGTVEALLQAFLRSASTPTDPAAFRRSWQEAGELLSAGRWPAREGLRFEDFAELDARARDAGHPAIHHSEEYLRRSDPAYRVVGRREAEALVRALTGGGTWGREAP